MPWGSFINIRLFTGEICAGVYDSRDVDRVKADDALLTCYMRSYGGNDLDVDKAAKQMDVVLKFRKEIGVNGNTPHCISFACRRINLLFKYMPT